jgi:hypothetical protein
MSTQRIFLFLATAAALLPLSACSVPAQDKLECLLPNGDKMILINEFDYQLGPPCGHCTSRVNNTGFEPYFKPSKGKRWADASTSPMGNSSLDTLENRQKLCAAFGSFGQSVSSNGNVILDSSTKQRLRNALGFDYIGAIYQNPLDQSLGLQKLSWLRYRYASKLAENTLVYELPYAESTDMDKNNIVGAKVLRVIQTISTDGGKTWSEPIITTDSKIFVMGKPLIEQTGIAKPGEYSIGPGK